MKFKLEAINVLLDVINELPIEIEEDIDNIPEAKRASQILDEVKSDVLSEGWNFNTDEGWSFAPDTNGYINIPENVLDIVSQQGNIIMRDWRLYDKDKKSPIFEQTVKCNVVWDYDFNSLTYPIRQYITIRASRQFNKRMFGDTESFNMSEEDERVALLNARRSDGRTSKYNMLTSDFGSNTYVRFD